MFEMYNSNKFHGLLFSQFLHKNFKNNGIKVFSFKFDWYKESLISSFSPACRKIGIILFFAFCVNQLFAQTPPAGFSSSTVSSNWNQAVGLTFSKNGNQMFVWEKSGKVWVVENNIKSLLIDISEEVGNWVDFGLLGFALHPEFETTGYFYLLYMVDRHYLMHYGTSTYSATTNEYLNATIGRLTRYTATKLANGYSVNLNSRKILIGSTKSTGIPSLHKSHGVGSVVFGSDGTLLISTGDGASYLSNDGGNATESYYAQALADGIITSQENVGAFRSQLLESYDGKILRIDAETGDGIPSNPFFETNNPGSVRSKVWALGLRNPFRMILKPNSGSLNPAEGNPGALYLGDVGYNTWEEMNVAPKPGHNFGWPLFEGLTSMTGYTNLKVYNKYVPNPLYGVNGCTQQYFYFQDLLKQATASGTATFTNPCNTTQRIPNSINTFLHTRPVIDFKHGTTGPSRTGTFNSETATVVNIGADGSPVAGPQFSGNAAVAGCFYTREDFPIEYINTLFFGDYARKWIRNMTVDETDKPIDVRNFIDSGGAIVVAMATHPNKSGIYYVNYPSEIKKVTYINKLPVAVASSDKTYGPSSLSVQFTGSKSTDPDGRRLSYSWDFGDGNTSTLVNPSHTFVTDTLTNYTVTLTVTDSLGGNDQASLVISVNNTPPAVTISSPANNTLYPMTRDTEYALRATVSDQEHASSQLSYQWQTILHHDDHQHPEPIDTSRETTTAISPAGCGEETYYYRITLTVTDAAGLATTKEVKLYPDCNSTNPPANTAPELAPIGSKSVTAGQTLNFTAAATDADAGQTQTFSLVVAPQGAVINATTGDFSWAPDQAGTYTFTVRVTDNGSPAMSDEEQITVTVTTLAGNITQTLSPLADAFVRNGTYATKNYGTDTSLLVKSSPSSGYTRSSYLKFSLSSLSKVGSARLRIYGRNTENTSSINMSVYGLDNDTWTESGITWNNAPAASSAALGVVGVNNGAKYYEIDVSNFVRTQFAGDKIVSFLIKDAAAKNKNLLFSSKENRQNKPQLVIETGDNDLTPPVVNIRFNGSSNSPNSYNNQVEVVINSSDEGGSGLVSTQYSLNGAAYQNYNGPFIINTPGNYTITAKATDGKGNTSVTDQISFSVVSQATQTLTPLADAFVRNGTYATKNYGTDTSLAVKSSASGGYSRSSYLKFSLSNVSNVSSAKLRIYGRNTENTATINMSAYGSDNDTWTESGITWNNAPAAPSAALGVVGVNNLAKYYEIDVTNFVKTQLSGDKIVSFLIKDAATQNKNLQFNSKENRQNKPQLIITTSSAVTATRALAYNATTLSSENNLDKPKVFPNPLQKRFDIKFPNTYDREVTLQIIDEVGKLYEIGKLRLKPGGSTISVNISNFSLRKGVYFLKIQAKTKSDIIKLIVQ